MCLYNVISDAYLYGIIKANVMCGILAVIGKRLSEEKIGGLSKRMSHRGPDESDVHVTEEGYVLREIVYFLKPENNLSRELQLPG